MLKSFTGSLLPVVRLLLAALLRCRLERLSAWQALCFCQEVLGYINKDHVTDDLLHQFRAGVWNVVPTSSSAANSPAPRFISQPSVSLSASSGRSGHRGILLRLLRSVRLESSWRPLREQPPTSAATGQWRRSVPPGPPRGGRGPAGGCRGSR